MTLVYVSFNETEIDLNKPHPRLGQQYVVDLEIVTDAGQGMVATMTKAEVQDLRKKLKKFI